MNFCPTGFVTHSPFLHETQIECGENLVWKVCDASVCFLWALNPIRAMVGVILDYLFGDLTATWLNRVAWREEE